MKLQSALEQGINMRYHHLRGPSHHKNRNRHRRNSNHSYDSPYRQDRSRSSLNYRERRR